MKLVEFKTFFQIFILLDFSIWLLLLFRDLKMLSHVFTSSIHLNVTLFQEKSVLIPTIHQAYEGYNHYRIRKHSPDPLVHHFDQGV